MRFFWPAFVCACTSETAPPDPPRCGDGRVDDGEVCDLGLENDDRGECKRDCSLQVCGDGYVGPSEECDDGVSNRDEGICRSNCIQQVCRDGFLGPDEACDDGNDVDADTCTNGCALPTCGDGIVQVGEECDDLNADETDECLPTCLAARCGDGVIRSEVEECDDANAEELDGCMNACLRPAVIFGSCGEEGWAPVEDGAEFAIFHGFQGCCHFYGCVRERGIVVDPPVSIAFRVVDDLETEWAPFVDAQLRPDDWLEDGDGWREMIDIQVRMGLQIPEDLEGRVLELTVRLTEDDLDVFTDVHSLTVYPGD